MRQSHGGGEKLFIDYAGDKMPVVVDRLTGEVRDAHIFVAVMGGSSLPFGYATWTEQMGDWIDAHYLILWSTAAIPTWRAITARQCCRPVHGVPAIKQS